MKILTYSLSPHRTDFYLIRDRAHAMTVLPACYDFEAKVVHNGRLYPAVTGGPFKLHTCAMSPERQAEEEDAAFNAYEGH